MVDAARKIRAAFIPTLDALQARYDADAKAAQDHEPLLDAHLSDRADTKDRKAATVLRGQAPAKLTTGSVTISQTR